MNIKKVDIPSRELQSLGVQPPQSLRMFKGASTLDPLSMDKSYSPQLKNLSSVGFPGLATRQGNSALGAALGGRVLGLGVWKDTQLHAAANGVLNKWNGSSWDVVKSGLNTAAMWSFCNFQGNFTDINLLAANGINAVQKWDGTSWSDLSGAPAGAKYIDQHDNRLYVAVKNSVMCSALSKGTDWTTLDDSGEIDFETNNGEEINGVKAGSKHVLVFKNSSVHELWGTNPLNFQKEMVASDIGILSNQCAVVIQGAVYWMDRNSAYVYGGARPRRDFALPVKGYFENMNPAALSKASAGTDGTNLYLAIPSALSTEADTVLEYDTQYQTWYVWKDLTPTVFAMMGGDWYAGDSLGKVLKMGGTTDNGAAINYEWVSAPFGGGSLAQRLQWYKMWYVADVPAGSTMNVYLSKSAEGEDWTLVKNIPANELQTGRIIIPVNTVANSNWVRVKFAGSGPMKITEFDYQQRDLPML